jgi:hypothetical protein
MGDIKSKELEPAETCKMPSLAYVLCGFDAKMSIKKSRGY